VFSRFHLCRQLLLWKEYREANPDGYRYSAVVDRAAIMAQLAAAQASDAFQYEEQRKTRIFDELERVRRLAAARKVRIGVAPYVHEGSIAGLPGRDRSAPGRTGNRVPARRHRGPASSGSVDLSFA
jgi:hypothetical protein